MLLAIDIGNTNIVFGIFSGRELAVQWRCVTDPSRTGDDYGGMALNFLKGTAYTPERIDGAVIACVVPQVLAAMRHVCTQYFKQEPLIVTPDINLGIEICYETPLTLGVDRIVNAAAAFEKYPGSLIVIDFGTATTFDYVSARGQYEGGAIAPGITMVRDALAQRTSQLPQVELEWPGRVVGKNTVESMQSGILAGYVSMVDGMVERMRQETGDDPYVVATGGLAWLVSKHSRSINTIDQDLTLEGLRIIFEKNRKTV